MFGWGKKLIHNSIIIIITIIVTINIITTIIITIIVYINHTHTIPMLLLEDQGSALKWVFCQ